MKTERNSNLLWLIATMLLLSSCAPHYLSGPTVYHPITENLCTFGLQNMDNNGKVENNTLTCHYDGFDVTYTISNSFLASLEIANNSNKSLIIDKSKCYVLYSGYSTQLFKDARSSRSTTFNNVQDAINNVKQTTLAFQ